MHTGNPSISDPIANLHLGPSGPSTSRAFLHSCRGSPDQL